MGCLAKDVAAGALGGTAAGLLLSGMFLGMERVTGKPSVLVELGRKAAAKLGSPYRYNPSKAAPEEQAMSHAGHLALSAAMGAVYPAFHALPGMGGVSGGLLFGAGFYPLLWGALGPLIGLTPTPREEGLATVAQRVALHAGFGLVTALVANAVSPRAARQA